MCLFANFANDNFPASRRKLLPGEGDQWLDFASKNFICYEHSAGRVFLVNIKMTLPQPKIVILFPVIHGIPCFRNNG
jgi:hypothetical protein